MPDTPLPEATETPAPQAQDTAVQAQEPAVEAQEPTAQTQGPATDGPAKPKAGKSPRAAFQVLERLFQLYPKMFGARFLPLKLGVYQEILARHPDDFKKEDLKAALGLHARSTRYLEAVASGLKRHDLEGNPVEDVAPEHVHHAIMEVFRRRQARSKEDLKPWLRARLLRAIEASGLPREEYVERVNARDEVSLAALDDAFGELAEQVARREALRRAYEASGRTVEAFAEMYGLEVKAVKRALARPAGPTRDALTPALSEGEKEQQP